MWAHMGHSLWGISKLQGQWEFRVNDENDLPLAFWHQNPAETSHRFM
jgi:hypothetical protein